MLNKWETFWKTSYIVGIILMYVVYWDITSLNIAPTWDYILMKFLIIASFFVMGFWAQIKKDVTYLQDIFAIIFFFYSAYGLAYLDITYYYSFIEGFVFFGLILVMSTKRFLFHLIFAYVLFVMSLELSSEPDFMITGKSFKPHVLTAVSIVAFQSFFFQYYVTRYREENLRLNEKFTLIGKQSSFLMHEIKSPLSRVIRRVDLLNRDKWVDEIKDDSSRISSIVHGVEVLVGSPDKFRETFDVFNWYDLIHNLRQDFEHFFEAKNIVFLEEGFSGKAKGNKHLLYQVLKNLMTNSIEAIADSGGPMIISLKLEKNENSTSLIFENTNSSIPKGSLKKVFEPMYTTKKNEKNKGLGLSFSKSIVEAHAGVIEVKSNTHATTFYITFPKEINASLT